MTELAWPGAELAECDRSRFRAYADALAFVEGDQWVGRRKRGETRLTINYARALPRKVASYVFPAPVTFSVDPGKGDPGFADRAERLLAGVIAANSLDQLDVALCIEASVLGDAAVKVTWSIERGEPSAVPVDPATLCVRAAPDDPRRIEQATQAYRLQGAGVERLFRGAGGALDPVREYPVIERWTETRWTVDVAGQRVRDEENPYGWIPYVRLINNPRPHAVWGESDLVDLYDICRELNGRMSVLARVLELSGAPIAVLENVDGSDGITVGPGAKWELPEGAKAYLLDLLAGGGAGLHIEYVNLLYRMLHDLSETPRTAFGDGGRALSGAALEVEIQPLVQRVGRKRRAFEGFYRERNARLLDLLERFGGQQVGGLRNASAIWPSVLPSDTDAAARNTISLVSAGIQSRRTAIAALGGTDPDAELARITAEVGGVVE